MSFTKKNGALLDLVQEKTLKSISVHENQLSIQAKFLFSNSLSTPKYVLEDNALSIFFPQVKLGSFNRDGVFESFYKTGLVEKIEIIDNSSELGVRVNLVLLKDKVVLTSNMLQHSNENLVVLEIFKKEDFSEILRCVDGPILLSFNEYNL